MNQKEIWISQTSTLQVTGTTERLEPLTSYKNRAKIIDIGGSFTIVSKDCFKNYKYVTKIIFPDTIETIEDNIIHSTDALESITLPRNVKNLYKGQPFDWSYAIKYIYMLLKKILFYAMWMVFYILRI